jgi:hypothetical protein
MDTQYGWKCPQCSVIHAPWQERCPSCSTPKTTVASSFGPLYGTSGTINVKGVTFSGFGTVFYSPPKTEPVRAYETVKTWIRDGNSAKTLIDAAVQVLIDNACEDEEDEDEDD